MRQFGARFALKTAPRSDIEYWPFEGALLSNCWLYGGMYDAKALETRTKLSFKKFTSEVTTGVLSSDTFFNCVFLFFDR